MPNAKINYNIVGTRLKQARQKAGLGQVELSAILDVDYHITVESSVLSRMERGKRPIRDVELQALCKILDISSDWLLGLKD